MSCAGKGRQGHLERTAGGAGGGQGGEAGVGGEKGEMNEKADEPQEQAADRPPIPEEQLKKILEAHRKWVESEGKKGKVADLREANLCQADLRGANLQEAYLGGANLEGANLLGARGLTPSQVKIANNWELAIYSDDLLKKLDLPPDHNERVKKKLAELEKKEKATIAKP